MSRDRGILRRNKKFRKLKDRILIRDILGDESRAYTLVDRGMLQTGDFCVTPLHS